MSVGVRVVPYVRIQKAKKFCQRGSNSDNFVLFFRCFLLVFLVDEGRKDPNNAKSGPSLARQRNAIKWHFAGGPMMAQH